MMNTPLPCPCGMPRIDDISDGYCSVCRQRMVDREIASRSPSTRKALEDGRKMFADQKWRDLVWMTGVSDA